MATTSSMRPHRKLSSGCTCLTETCCRRRPGAEQDPRFKSSPEDFRNIWKTRERKIKWLNQGNRLPAYKSTQQQQDPLEIGQEPVLGRHGAPILKKPVLSKEVTVETTQERGLKSTAISKTDAFSHQTQDFSNHVNLQGPQLTVLWGGVTSL